MPTRFPSPSCDTRRDASVCPHRPGRSFDTSCVLCDSSLLADLERAAQAQVLSMSMGCPLVLVSDAVARCTKEAFDADKAVAARLHLDALVRELDSCPCSGASSSKGTTRERTFHSPFLAGALTGALLATATLFLWGGRHARGARA
jgi:hypothetical protein